MDRYVFSRGCTAQRVIRELELHHAVLECCIAADIAGFVPPGDDACRLKGVHGTVKSVHDPPFQDAPAPLEVIWRRNIGTGLQEQTGRGGVSGGTKLGKTAAQEIAVLFSSVNGKECGREINAGTVGEPVGYGLAECDDQFSTDILDAS